MQKIFYRSDGQLRIIENGKQEVIARRASQYYYLSKDGDYVFFLDNSTHWHKGDLFIKHKGKKPELLGSNVNLIHVSPSADIVLFIDNFFNYNNSGNLYIVRNGGTKKCLDRNVSGTVMVVKKNDNYFKIVYEKNNKDLTYTLCVIDETGTKHILGKKFKNLRYYITNQDQIRAIGEIHSHRNKNKEVETLIFHDEELIDSNASGYYNSDTLDSVSFNEEVLKFQQHHFNQVFFMENTDEIVFQFSNHTASRYFIACEIAKRANWTTILESPYAQDDSINHIARFSKSQVDDILLLHYTLTGGSDFLFGYKLFGVNVNDLFNSTGPVYGKNGLDFGKILISHFMTKDTNEKIMIRNIQETIMEIHGFSYFRELRAFLNQTYLVPLQDHYGKAMNFYSKFVNSQKKENDIANQMKKIEEELILQGKIPSKWKSEAEMFRIIKEEYPSARMHASPDWLKPQHLDVYIEDMNIAFEYQGIQHFLPIEFFGGDEGLNKRLKLDNRKKELCLNHGVELIEWMFNEPVTKIILQKKIKAANLK